MNKLIALIAICCSIGSCGQNSTSTPGKETGKSNDIFQHQLPINIDTHSINIDAVKASPGIFKILLQNDFVRVIEYSLKPGERDMIHTHPAKSSYIVSGGKLKVHLENGETIIADEITGTASWMNYVGKHYVENIGNTTVTIVLTEIKSLE